MPKLKDLTGQRFGKLVITSRAPSKRTANGNAKTQWNAICDCGQETVMLASQAVGKMQSCGCLGYRFGRPRGASVSYKAWHKRLRRDLGLPSDFGCHDCSSEAHEWSYLGWCPDEQSDGRLPFCTHLHHYVSRCRSCHRKNDGNRLKEAS